MPGNTELVSVPIAIAAPVPISIPISTTIAVPVTAFVSIASPAVSIPATIIAIVATFSALFPVEPTDVTVAVAAIPPSIGIAIAIVLGQQGSIFDSVRRAGRAGKREEGTGCKKDSFHVSGSL